MKNLMQLDVARMASTWRDPDRDRYRWIATCAGMAGATLRGMPDDGSHHKGDIILSLDWLRESSAGKAGFTVDELPGPQPTTWNEADGPTIGRALDLFHVFKSR